MPTSFQGFFSQLKIAFDAVFGLLFTQKCVSCDKETITKSRGVCFACATKINWTKPFSKEVNSQILQGINLSNVKEAHGLFYYSKEGVEQALIHRLKYRGSWKTGLFLGEKLGLSIIELTHDKELDCLIPIPLFHRKKFDRGYNQAYYISKGFSSITGIPIKKNLVRKRKQTQTQTKLTREKRRMNVKNTFVVSEELKKLKTIGLIDDVVTTGSTLREVCKEIINVNGTIKIIIFTIGVARIE